MDVRAAVDADEATCTGGSRGLADADRTRKSVDATNTTNTTDTTDTTGTGHAWAPTQPAQPTQPGGPRAGDPAPFVGIAASALAPLTPADLPDLHDFLMRADLTLSGLDAAGVRLWLLRDGGGKVRGSTGYELSAAGDHALIRSVAVDRDARGRGLGLELAHFALDRAAAAGARRAWLFSRRSGPFWQRLGFEPADRTRLATVLADTHQVTLFRASGQLDREVAWSRDLDRGASHPTPAR